MSNIVSYDRNADGTIRFIDENGQTVLNAPSENPMTLMKIDEIQNKWSPAGVQRPAPSGGAMGQVGQVGGYYGAQSGDMPPPMPGTPPQPQKPSGPMAQPFGPGSTASGLQGGASRGLHSVANAIGGRVLADREKAKQADNPYDRMTELAGQSGAMHPDERQAYEETRARIAKAREEEERALKTDLRYPAPLPVRQPMGGERIDPATGAILPDMQTDKDKEREAYGGG